MDSPRSATRIFILDENIHVTRVVTLSSGKLDTISKNNLREIVLRKRPVCEVNSLILYTRLA